MWPIKKRTQAPTITTRHHEKVTILELSGKVVHRKETDVLRKSVGALLREGRSLILVDLRQVFYVDSWGIGELAVARKRIQESGGTLKVLLSRSGRMRDLFTLIDIIPPFETYIDEGDALNSF